MTSILLRKRLLLETTFQTEFEELHGIYKIIFLFFSLLFKILSDVCWLANSSFCCYIDPQCPTGVFLFFLSLDTSMGGDLPMLHAHPQSLIWQLSLEGAWPPLWKTIFSLSWAKAACRNWPALPFSNVVVCAWSAVMTIIQVCLGREGWHPGVQDVWSNLRNFGIQDLEGLLVSYESLTPGCGIYRQGKLSLIHPL